MQKSAGIVLKNCLCLKKNEKLLIVTDSKLYNIAKIFFDVAKKITNNAALIKIPISNVHGTEPSKDVAKEMLKYDVELLITTNSLSHTKARQAATKAGARIASMPGINEDVAKRTLVMDCKKLKEENNVLIKKLKKGRILRVTTKKGTDISLKIFNKKWFDDSGVYSRKKDFGNLPAGEVSFMPAKGKSEGVFVVDGSIGGLGLVDKPVKIFVENGYVTRVLGGKTAKRLERSLITRKHRNIAECSLGTNPNAKITGVVLEDEKVKGTIHIAMGNNQSYGGSVGVPFHVDCVIKNPNVFIDGKRVMTNGKFVI